MPETTSEGKIRLTWQQITYFVGVLVFLVLGYADIKNTLRDLDSKISGVYMKSEVYSKTEMDKSHQATLKRIRKIERRLGIDGD